MQIESAIIAYLKANSNVTAKVSARIHLVRAPQNVEQPYIVVSKISAQRVSSHDGGSGLALARFQFSCFGKYYKDVKETTAALQSALEGYSGTIGGVGGVNVNGVFYEDETDLDEPDSNLFHTAVDYRFIHEE